MTIPKNAGLSRLADVSNVNDGIIRYPIKKKGQPRQLNPNWPAIHWLEDETETDTEIVHDYPLGELIPLTEESEFRVQRALGYHSARQKGMYPWPMFQTYSGFKASMIGYLDPCPACDDWSRTSQCEEHHDRDGVAGLKMGDQRRQDRRRARDAAAGRQVVNAYASPSSMADRFRAALDNSQARYTPRDGRQYFTQADQDIERERQRAAQARLYAQTPCTCSMCTGRPDHSADALRYSVRQDPNEGRPGYHYNLASDRWERDTVDPLGDFRAGGFRMPDELLRPARERWAEAVASLPDGTIEISNATIEVNGETLQGVQSFTIHIERNADGT